MKRAELSDWIAVRSMSHEDCAFAAAMLDGALAESSFSRDAEWMSALSYEMYGVRYCVACDMPALDWPVGGCRVCRLRGGSLPGEGGDK